MLFCYYSKKGVVPFGSKNVMNKFKVELISPSDEDEDNSWQDIFDEDQDEINNGVWYDEENYAFIQRTMINLKSCK